MRNRRGNPSFVKGTSGNPEGRPKGQSSLATYYHDPDLFDVRHNRWWRFCLEYGSVLGNGAEAARRAGYSQKSSRFIASRLLKRDVIRVKLNEINELTRLRPIPVRQGFMIIRCPHCRKKLTVNGLGEKR